MIWWKILKLRYGGLEAKQQAAYDLGQSKDPRGVDALIAALTSHDERKVHESVAAALGQTGDPRSFTPLVDALGRGCESAVEALLTIGGAKAIEPLVEALRHKESSEVRAAAAKCLGKLADARAQPALEAALSDRNRDVRMSAAVALAKLGSPKAVRPLAAVLRNPKQGTLGRWLGEARDALEVMGRPAIEALLADLESEDKQFRDNAELALGELADKAKEALIPFLETQNWKARLAAATVLAEKGERRGIDALVAALEDAAEDVRSGAAVRLVGMVGESPLSYWQLELALKAYKGDNEFVRQILGTAMMKAKQASDNLRARFEGRIFGGKRLG